MARSPIFLITGFALCFTCFGQTKLSVSPLSHVKLMEDFVPAVESKAPAVFPIEGFGPGKQGGAPGPKTQRRRRIAQLARASQVGSRCGHIIMKPPPAGIDSKALYEVPKGGSETMPVIKGLPVCAEDMR